MDWIGLDWIGLGQKSYVSKFLQPFLFAQSFTGIPYCIGLVVPSYYLLLQKLTPGIRDCSVINTFRKYLKKYLDEKYWGSITALHWMATLLDPSFKHFDFIPQSTSDEARFKRNLLKDIDYWMAAEMKIVADKLQNESNLSRLEF